MRPLCPRSASRRSRERTGPSPASSGKRERGSTYPRAGPPGRAERRWASRATEPALPGRREKGALRCGRGRPAGLTGHAVRAPAPALGILVAAEEREDGPAMVALRRLHELGVPADLLLLPAHGGGGKGRAPPGHRSSAALRPPRRFPAAPAAAVARSRFEPRPGRRRPRPRPAAAPQRAAGAGRARPGCREGEAEREQPPRAVAHSAEAKLAAGRRRGAAPRLPSARRQARPSGRPAPEPRGARRRCKQRRQRRGREL